MSTILHLGLGVIGGPMTFLLAKIKGVGRLILVDPDTFQRSDLRTHPELRSSDVGQPKATAIARKVKELNPDIEVTGIVGHAETIPLGLYRRASLITSGVDRRSARYFLGRVPYALGRAWLDAAVQADGILTRLSLWIPGPGAPCGQCSWTDTDYALLDTPYTCRGTPSTVAPTGTTAAHGALAAAVAALHAEAFLTRGDCTVAGCELLIDSARSTSTLTVVRRDRGCRFDHIAWQVADMTLGLEDAVEALLDRLGVVEVPGRVLVSGLACASCGSRRQIGPVLDCSVAVADSQCPCGGEARPTAFDMTERISLDCLSPVERRRSLREFGFRPGEIVHALGSDHYYEIGGGH